MSTSVSNANSSFYDPNGQLSHAEGCNPSNASCGPPPQAPREVAIPPVPISGDAGVQQLVKQLDDALRTPDCSLEAKSAALSCAKVGVVAAAGVLASASVAGAVVGIAATLAESITCGKDLRAYYDCDEP